MIVMHPSAEIVSSLFLFREKTRQHMQRIGTHRFKQAGVSCSRDYAKSKWHWYRRHNN